MTLTLQDVMSADMARVFFKKGEFAVDGFYNGSSTPIPVIMEYADVKTGRPAFSATANVQKSDVSSPVYQNTLMVDGVIWTIDKPVGGDFDQDESTWFLPLIRDQRVGPWRT